METVRQTPFEIYNAVTHEPGGDWEYITFVYRGHRQRTLRGTVPGGGYLRTELVAILNTLNRLPTEAPARVYLRHVRLVHALMEGGIEEWEGNGWRRTSGGRLENADLWREIRRFQLRGNVSFRPDSHRD